MWHISNTAELKKSQHFYEECNDQNPIVSMSPVGFALFLGVTDKCVREAGPLQKPGKKANMRDQTMLVCLGAFLVQERRKHNIDNSALVGLALGAMSGSNLTATL